MTNQLVTDEEGTPELRETKGCRRPRLLMLAYACTPGSGSENGVGWNRAVQAGRFADTWVICEGRECEADVRQHIAESGPVPGVRFVFVPLSDFQVRLGKVPGCYYLAHHLWHRAAYAVAKRLHEEHHFDLAHQANMVGYREPGLLWRLPIPFVWGPVGGTQDFPTRFLSILSLRGAIRELSRTALNSAQLRTSRRIRAAARKASVTLAANTTNQRDLERACGVPVLRMTEVGVNRVSSPRQDEAFVPGRLRILWSGQVETHKALSLLIEAASRLPADVAWQLRVLGDGSLLNACRRLAQRLGIDKRIEWLGWRSHAEAFAQYPWADVFAFTSLRDTTGSVVLEALSHGVPVVCLDHQGVGDVITADCGVKIPVTSPKKVIRELAEALEQLARNPARRRSLSLGALERADEYHWSRQGDRMAGVYRRVLAEADSDAEVCEHGAPAEAHRFRDIEVLA